MADQETGLPPTPEEVAAGLITTDKPTMEETIPQSAEVAAAQQRFEAAIKKTTERDGYTTLGVIGDAVANTATGHLAVNAWNKINSPVWHPDAAFTEDRFNERLKAAMTQLPEEYWGDLDSAVSDQHFDYLLARTKENVDRIARLNENGWGPWGASMLAQVADPANFLIGSRVFQGAQYLAEGAKLGFVGRRLANAAAGAAHSAAYIAAQDAEGNGTNTSEYVMATGLGLVLGGALGPISKNPQLKGVAQGMVNTGKKLVAQARKAQNVKPDVAGPTAVARAAEVPEAQSVKVTPIQDPEPIVSSEASPTPEVQNVDPATAPTDFNWRRQSLQGVLMKGDRKAVEDILAKVPDEELSDLMTAQRVAVDPMTPPIKIREAIANAVEERVASRRSAANDGKSRGSASKVEEKFRGISSKADEEPTPNVGKEVAEEGQEVSAPENATRTRIADLEEIEATADHLKNPRFVAAYRGKAGVEYRIYAETGDMSGPYRVARVDEGGKTTNVGRSIDDVQTARQYIPRDEIKEPVVPEVTQAPEMTNDSLELPHMDIDNETLRARIDELRAQLHEADPETAQQIEDAIKFIQEQAASPENNSTTGAMATPAPVLHRPEFFDAGSPWYRVRDDNVPKPAFAGARIDRSGVLGRTRNAAARLIGNKLFNNTVGMADNSVAQRTVDLDQIRLAHTYLTPSNQVRKAQFPEWARAMGFNRLNRWQYRDLFEEHVATAIRDAEELPENLPDAARQAVTRTADVDRQLADMTLKDMQNPLRNEGKTAAPLPEADRVADNPSYLWRRYLPERVMGFVETHGTDALTRLFRGAIGAAQPDIEEGLLDRLARGFVRNLVNRSYNVGDEWTIALREGDRLRFARLLREDSNFTDQEIDHVMSVLWDHTPDPRSGFQHLKHRVLMDEYFRDEAGRRVVDLLDNNALRLITTYARRVSGRVALARMRIYAPSRPRFRSVLERSPDGRTISRQIEDGMEGGELLVDGVRSDAEIENLFEQIRRWGATEDNRSAVAGNIKEGLAKETNADIDMLRFAIDRVLARPNPAQQTKLAQTLRNIRDYNFMRLMWQGGVAQLSETGSTLGTLGVHAVFSQVPGFTRIVDAMGRSRLRDALASELEAMGIGVERLHGIHIHNMEHYDDLPFTPRTNSLHDRITSWLQAGTKLTNEGSLMAFVTQMQERQAAAAFAQRLANIGVKLQKGGKLTGGETRRLAQLGMSEESLNRVFANMKQHADFTDGVFFKNKLARLNVHNWDLQTRAEFEDALFKMTRKLVQAGDLGNTTYGMSDPIMQTMFQFRNFTMTAWQNSTLYNAQMRDPEALLTVLWSMGWAAAVRGAQVSLAASLMAPDEGRRYKEKYGTIDQLARAGFQRSGFSSVLPMMMDTGLNMAGQKNMFDARNTGQSSNALFGNPSFTLLDNAGIGIGGVADSFIHNRKLSQPEIRALQNVLPGGTSMVIGSAISQLIKDRPRKAPRRKDVITGD